MARNQMIADMHRAEAKLRKSLSGDVRTLSRDEIEALAPTLKPPVMERCCLEYGYVDR